MRLNGEDIDMEPLTVGELKRFIADYETKTGKSLDALPIHWLRMVGTEDDDSAAYATHVDLDAFDGTEDDPDDEHYHAHWALCLYHGGDS